MKLVNLSFFLCMSLLIGQTAEQIQQAKKIVRQKGLSENDVRQAARARGYSEKQIDDAIKKSKSNEINKFTPNSQLDGNSNKPTLETSNNDGEYEIDDQNIFKEEINMEDEESDLKIASKLQPGMQKLTHFGYNIFSKDPALFQATTVGAVDPSYLIGPGDEIIVMLWGETQFRQVLTVDREGFIFIPEIGQVFVNGLNLNMLESKLFRVFSQFYASLDPLGKTPTTFLDISLGNLRPLRIQVLGEVSQPGAYTVSPSSTLFSALYYFNGPTTSGSLRDIRLIRGGNEITSIDFYEYLLTGKRPKDIKLQLDDVIFIPRRLSTISIMGEINRPGIYELKSNEKLKDLIAIAGELKISAYLKRLQIDRIVPFEKRLDLKMDRMYTDVELSKVIQDEISFPLQDGDKVNIFSILDIRKNIVELTGAVTRPGRYDLGDSLTILDLINKADGLIGDAYLERLDVTRVNPDFSEELIKLSLEKILESDREENILLQGLDKVRIYGMTEMESKNFVSIEGYVRKPGRYRLQKNMKIYDLIFKARGFLDKEFEKAAYLDRADLIRLSDDGVIKNIKSFNLGNILQNPESEENIFLKPYDLIRIYKKTMFFSEKSVSIQGVVRKPGTYGLKRQMSLKDLILEAGGLNEDIYRYRAEVSRINPLNENLESYADLHILDVDGKLTLSSQLHDKSINELENVHETTFLLKAYDLITIRPDPFFNNQKQLTIEGEVLFPGEYTILSYQEKITDILNRAGGTKPNAFLQGSQYLRQGQKINVDFVKIMKNKNSKFNFTVQPGDKIIIVSQPNLVYINGEVNNPGIHKFNQGKRLRYYLESAGGYNQDADKDNIWITYPNGDSKKYKKWSLISPKVQDGSSINVSKQREREPFDKTEFAKEVTGIVANLAQAIMVVLIARN